MFFISHFKILYCAFCLVQFHAVFILLCFFHVFFFIQVTKYVFKLLTCRLQYSCSRNTNTKLYKPYRSHSCATVHGNLLYFTPYLYFHASDISSVKLQARAKYNTKFYTEVSAAAAAAADWNTNNNPVIFVVPVQLQGMIIRESDGFNL